MGDASELAGRVRAAPRPSAAERCAVCHDGLEASDPAVARCERCGTAVHADCGAQLGRCPTLGCDAPLAVLRREGERLAPLEPDVGPGSGPSAVRAAAVAVVTACLLAGAGALAGSREPDVARAAPGLVVAMALVHFLLAPALWARRVGGEGSSGAPSLAHSLLVIAVAEGLAIPCLVGGFAVLVGMVAIGSAAANDYDASVRLGLGCVAGLAALLGAFGPTALAWLVGREPWARARRTAP